MYPGTLRSPTGGNTTSGAGSIGGYGSALPVSSLMRGPPYTYYMKYPHVASIDLHQLVLAAWGSPYNPLPEDCSALYPGQSSAMGTVSMNHMILTPAAFTS